jgi:hypothetical protein
MKKKNYKKKQRRPPSKKRKEEKTQARGTGRHATALPSCKAYLLLPSYLLDGGKLILWLRAFPLFFFVLGGLCCFFL